MTSWIVMAYFLMFLKGNVAVEDISYIYLLSNLIGGIILVSRLHLDYGKISLGPLVYIVVNVSLLVSRILEIEIISIGLTGTLDYVLSISMIAVLFYNLIFPVFSFSELFDNRNRTAQSVSTRVRLPLNTALFIAPLVLITFFFSPLLTGILVALLILFEYLTLWQASSASQQVKIR